MKTIFSVLLFFSVMGANAFDHSLPYKTIKGLYNGQVVTAEELESHFEVVSRGKNLKIYIYNNEVKPQDVSAYTVTAKTQLSSTKKQEDLLLKAKGKYFEASFYPKGVKKYDLYLAVKNNKTAKEDLLKYTLKSP